VNGAVPNSDLLSTIGFIEPLLDHTRRKSDRFSRFCAVSRSNRPGILQRGHHWLADQCGLADHAGGRREPADYAAGGRARGLHRATTINTNYSWSCTRRRRRPVNGDCLARPRRRRSFSGRSARWAICLPDACSRLIPARPRIKQTQCV